MQYLDRCTLCAEINSRCVFELLLETLMRVTHKYKKQPDCNCCATRCDISTRETPTCCWKHEVLPQHTHSIDGDKPIIHARTYLLIVELHNKINTHRRTHLLALCVLWFCNLIFIPVRHIVKPTNLLKRTEHKCNERNSIIIRLESQ